MLLQKGKERRLNVKTTIKVHRINRGISIEDAAEALGITVEELRKYEAYEETMSYELLLKMMDLYHIEDFSDIIFYNKSQERAAYAERGINITYLDELPHIS
jgi:transcriptional regulator with XRE-family HTH domain